MVRIEVLLRRCADDRTVLHTYETEDEYRDVQVFSWVENNFSCDCNRHEVFERELRGDPDFEDDDFPCGHEAYAVDRINADNTTIYARQG